MADASATGAAFLGMLGTGRLSRAKIAAAVPPGPVYEPGADHVFYITQHRAFQALRQGLWAQEAALAHLLRPAAGGPPEDTI